ncbi:MAG: hypothetical protein EON59_17290 [Alphaproteobacteria bacterium]|nr:MAG: hypothetical protein EON59_17290 [Alphaproteobacteria bacterium]
MFAAALLLAQTAPACTAMDANLPAPLAGWAMTHKGLMLGHAGTLDATDGKATTDFRIDTAGTYGIALDQPGWIDVAAKGGAALVSVKHGHGPDCSTIRKIVRFELKPGAYTLTLAKLTKPVAKVMLVRD